MGGSGTGTSTGRPVDPDAVQRDRRTRIPATSPRSTEGFHTFVREAFLGVLTPGYSKR